MTSSLLRIQQLSITSSASEKLVQKVSLDLNSGEWLALVGESGSGKTLTGLACLRLLPAGLNSEGTIHWQGQDLASLSPERLRQLRGGDIGMVYQEPLTALNPLHRIGKHIDHGIWCFSRHPE